MKKYILILSVCLTTLGAYAQKDVYWIHGLNETSEFWGNYSLDISKSYTGADIDWTQGERISDIATDVNNTIKSYSWRNKHILVGHSTGGLIARSVQKQNSNVKGIVTVGTPNQGASVVKSLNNKAYSCIIDETVGKIEYSVIRSYNAAVKCAPPISWFAGWITGSIFGVAVNLSKAYINKVVDELDSTLETSFTNSATVQDMLPGSSYLQGLKSHTTVPIVNLYGQEDQWQAIRIAGSLANQDKIQDSTYVGENYDDYFFDEMQTVQGTIDEIAHVHDEVYQALKWPAILMPWIWGTRELVLSAKHEWLGVGRYVDHDIHNKYTELIGAVRYETRTYTTGWWLWKKTHYETVPIYGTHDGLISNFDSEMDTNEGISVHNVPLPGVNHMEMNGHKSVKDEREQILTSGKYNRTFQQNANY